MHGPVAAKPSDSSAEAGGDLRFRIFRRGSWRRAFKLEEVFWAALEQAAKEAGVKLTDYVKFVLTEPDCNGNQASALRVHAARWLQLRLEDREERLRDNSPAVFLRAVPMPGFILAEKRGLTAYNAEFVSFVRRMADKDQLARLSEARLTLDAPIDRIIETLRESNRPALECGFLLAVNERRSRGRVRVSLVPGAGGRTELMGFVTAIERPRAGG